MIAVFCAEGCRTVAELAESVTLKVKLCPSPVCRMAAALSEPTIEAGPSLPSPSWKMPASLGAHPASRRLLDVRFPASP